MQRDVSRDTSEARLSNGLKVLLREDWTAPIATFWVWYRVGSRNEIPGKTGISHWVEHMQFKGTPRLGKGQIFGDVSRVGGTLNALTSQDWTAYFETVPADQLDLALAIESDRMQNSMFDPEEVESERTVILSERQGAENNPGYALYEEVTAAAFHAHPYRHMVIGYEADLKSMSRGDLYAHYRRFYQPNNAFIVAVGAFDTDGLVQRLENAFGDIPCGDVVAGALGVTEPPQLGERRVLLRKPSGAPHLRMAFHAPAANDLDFVPLLVVEAVLSGASPMGFGGGGAMGRSSRLYRSLVASGLARSAESDMSISIDPNLFQIGVTALPGGELAAIEDVLDHELDRLRTEAVSADELSRALRQLEAQLVYSTEGVTNQAYWRGQWDIVDDWRRAETLANEIRDVCAEDVQRVAVRYFSSERRTVGWLEPSSEGSAGVSSRSRITSAGFPRIFAWGLDGPHESRGGTAGEFQRTVLSNGIPVLGQDRPGSRSITMRVRVPAGAVIELPTEGGLAHLTSRALLRGSHGQSFEEISIRTDKLGSSISIDAGREFVETRVRCLQDDFGEMARLLAQTLVEPDFPSEEVEKVAAEQLGAIAESDNDTRATAERLLRRAVYPAPNPLGRRILGDVASVKDFNRNSVAAYHDREFSAAGVSIAVVGGFGGFDRAVGVIADAVGSWAGSQTSKMRTANRFSLVNDTVVDHSKTIPGKSQADIAAGIATVARGHPDYYALDIANLIFGRLGLMGRLGSEIRDRQGLAYYAFSQIEPRVDGSLWIARAGVDPANIERAVAALGGEIKRLRAELVSENELNDAKAYSVGALPLALESHDGVASTLLSIEQFGLGLDFLARYPKIIGQITREQVQEAVVKYLDPGRLAVGTAKPS
ncbi:MAG: insulinase family protein [Chloroflexia bacterium]|nr:insulinase family protein [Chloroflexia bacterium]